MQLTLWLEQINRSNHVDVPREIVMYSSQNLREVQLLGQAADLAKAAGRRELSQEQQGTVMGRDPTARPVLQEVPSTSQSGATQMRQAQAQATAFVFPPGADQSTRMAGRPVAVREAWEDCGRPPAECECRWVTASRVPQVRFSADKVKQADPGVPSYTPSSAVAKGWPKQTTCRRVETRQGSARRATSISPGACASRVSRRGSSVSQCQGWMHLVETRQGSASSATSTTWDVYVSRFSRSGCNTSQRWHQRLHHLPPKKR